MAHKEGYNNGPGSKKMVAPDGGYGWVVVAGASIMGALFTIPASVLSISFNSIMNIMSASATQVSMMATLLCCIFNIAGPLSSSYTQRTSCRRGSILGGLITASALFISVWVNTIELLTITFGCIAAIGTSFIMNPSTYVINEYFEKRRGLVTGIRMAGVSMGRVVFIPIFQEILSFYGYQGLLLLSSAIVLNCCVCGALFHPAERHLVMISVEEAKEPLKNKENEIATDIKCISQSEGMDKTPETILECLEPDSKKNEVTIWRKIYKMIIGELNFSLMKTPIFYLFFINNLANTLTLFYAYVFMIPFVMDKGLKRTEASIVLMALSFSDIIGRLVITSLMDIPKLGVRKLNIISCFANATMMWYLTMTNTFTSTVGVACILGFFCGGQLSGFVVLTAKIVGTKNVPTVFGLTQFLRGVTLLGFGPLLGKFRDLTGDFRVCYYIFASFNYIVAALWFVELCSIRRRNTLKGAPTQNHI